MSEELIREALHPYEGIADCHQGGLHAPGTGAVGAERAPRLLIAQAKGSLKKLGVEQIDLWQLHRIDPRVPRDEQFGAVRQSLMDTASSVMRG